jgi:hypothetical protein
MSLGARPLRLRDVEAIIDRKMADFRHKAGHLVLQHLDIDTFVGAASGDPEIKLAVDTGFIEDLASDLRDPVIVRLPDRAVLTCPPLALRVLADEPAEIHRAFVEGAFLRKFFRFFVPATFEGGEDWEIVSQVREIMQRHFAFQLVACETVLRQAS